MFQNLIKSYSFIFLIIAAGLLASWHSQSAFACFEISDTVLGVCIALIFTLQGIALSKKEFTQSYKPSKLPLFSLFWNFIGIPLLVLLIIFPFVNQTLKLGFFFLSILPSTIALAVSYTDMSGGRVGTALFSTCVSNLFGALYVPFMFMLFWGQNMVAQVGLLSVLETVLVLIIVPVLLGYFLRQKFDAAGQYLLRFKNQLVETLITVIIYDSFLDSFSKSQNAHINLYDSVTTIGLSLFLFSLVSFLVWFTSRFLKVDRASRIAVFYTASQKSLCSGIPLIALTLGAAGKSEMLGFLLLPLIFYYLFQTIFGSILTYRFKSLLEIN